MSCIRSALHLILLLFLMNFVCNDSKPSQSASCVNVSLFDLGLAQCYQNCENWCWATLLMAYENFFLGIPTTDCAKQECQFVSKYFNEPCCKLDAQVWTNPSCAGSPMWIGTLPDGQCTFNPIPHVPPAGAVIRAVTSLSSEQILLYYGQNACVDGPITSEAKLCGTIFGPQWSVLMNFSGCCVQDSSCTSSTCDQTQTMPQVASYLSKYGNYVYVEFPVNETTLITALTAKKPVIMGIHGDDRHAVGIVGVQCGTPNLYLVDDPFFGRGYLPYQSLLTYHPRGHTDQWTETVYTVS